MFEVGQRVQGERWNDQGEIEMVEGAFRFRTDDPEEHIQDIVITTDDGRTVYLDEQGVVAVADVQLSASPEQAVVPGLSADAQTMVANLEFSPMKAIMLSRLKQMVTSGADHDGTAKEVTEHFGY